MIDLIEPFALVLRVQSLSDDVLYPIQAFHAWPHHTLTCQVTHKHPGALPQRSPKEYNRALPQQSPKQYTIYTTTSRLDSYYNNHPLVHKTLSILRVILCLANTGQPQAHIYRYTNTAI
jgi:hypothetical protein